MWGKLLLAGMGVIAVKVMKDKYSTDNDEVDLKRYLRKSHQAIRRSSKEILRRHLGEQIVFTGAESNIAKRELDKDELLDGETSAFVSKVGCYTVRSAQRFESGEDGRKICITELSARHQNADNDGFLNAYNHICSVTEDPHTSWTEEILFICSVKKDVSTPDHKAELLVRVRYTGDSFSADGWYKMSPDGTVTEYQEHPYDPDSYDKPWES